MKIGLVVSEFNTEVTHEMEERAVEKADELGVEVITVRVPGAYDAPLAVKRLCERDGTDAVATAGAVVTGDTDHDAVVTETAAEALTRLSLEHDKPVTLGVAGPGMSGAEARERLDYGARAVESAVEMVRTLEGIED
ncbi:6,7-dimethyl-8-ribityllumazine synthase [Haladaptatus sp. F3-133]|jgi:6,7-dimethyl-8-ribityllumazine synthase|uniref:6,7-dimethyl-8-ribityllumazine synthase n=1 Tax=Halorutilus salinus TaxID=2487751 RepID=A0A9Q4GG92_9EURY|nr:6,7-dimethyl-8-ribityllumazine synthase [Halorutilus salinus]MCX2818452.1 6,7-dimethyl-8-ribityllumazine synthase [Halorutilus salinus]